MQLISAEQNKNFSKLMEIIFYTSTLTSQACDKKNQWILSLFQTHENQNLFSGEKIIAPGRYTFLLQ